ncbi:MAG: exodeoxyribonuclease VII small subunit [Pseudomonadota bacterium]
MTEPAENAASEKPVAEMSFEEAMRALETVVSQLERGDVELEQSITLYERGAALKAHCDAKLKAAEEKVDAITLDAEGKPAGTKPVEGL